MPFPTPIEHLLVLMFENRSFDHLLGFQTGGVDGLRDGMPPGVYPNLDPLTGAPSLPTASAGFLDPGRDPGHEPADVWTQLYQGRRGNAPPTATSLGFMQSFYEQHAPDPSVIMRCFAPDSLRALSALARSFTVCTHWHSSVPGPTWPNRFFLHTGTSEGTANSPSTLEIVYWNINQRQFPATIYSWLEGAGLSWTIYEHRRSQSRSLAPMHAPTPTATTSRNGFAPIAQLWQDLRPDAPKTLANFVFIEPDWMGQEENDMHPGPGGDVRRGDILLAQVYNALRASPYWSTSVLLVVFDEHGGLYDHVLPLTTVAPDNHPSDSSYVDFKHLGVRVPAVVISPYAQATTDIRTYDHTSVIATAGKLFGLEVPPTLGLRAAQAAAFVQTPLPPIRTDTPTSVDPTTSTDLHYDPNVPLDDNQRLNLALAAADASRDTTAAAPGPRSLQPMLQDSTLVSRATAIQESLSHVESIGDAERFYATLPPARRD